MIEKNDRRLVAKMAILTENGSYVITFQSQVPGKTISNFIPRTSGDVI